MFEKHCCKARTREVGGWGGLSAASDAGGGGGSSESMSRALTHGPRTASVKQGKIIVSVHVAHVLGFRPSNLVAVVDNGRRSSSDVRCHPTRP